MNSKIIGSLATIIGLIGLVAQYVPDVLVSRWADQGFESMLPVFGSAGREWITYSYLAEFVGVGVTAGLALVLGYYVARRVDLPTEFERVVKSITLGSILAVAVGTAVVRYVGTFESSTAFEILTLVLQFTGLFVNVGLLVIIGAIAGTAIAHFRQSDHEPATPSHATTDTPVRSRAEETGDDGPIDSTPAR